MMWEIKEEHHRVMEHSHVTHSHSRDNVDYFFQWHKLNLYNILSTERIFIGI